MKDGNTLRIRSRPELADWAKSEGKPMAFSFTKASLRTQAEDSSQRRNFPALTACLRIADRNFDALVGAFD